MRLSRRNPVPGEFALLYEFVNSQDLRRFVEGGAAHAGGDELATAAALELWMRRRGLLDKAAALGGEDHRNALALRGALRSFLELAPADRHRGAKPATILNAAAAKFPLIVQASAAGDIRLSPLARPRANGLGIILAELHHAAETGNLDRLKICAAAECRWLFFDRSKPCTRRWCATALCGNREKTRAYRSRRREASGSNAR